ncbi:MAG: hypothetical protein HFH67_06080 [Lachnospiraceae bacterium]|jgi:hypothetical protein|nr:hypothetical protein [Lachnospiraceae bacterium]
MLKRSLSVELIINFVDINKSLYGSFGKKACKIWDIHISEDHKAGQVFHISHAAIQDKVVKHRIAEIIQLIVLKSDWKYL